MKNSIKIYFPTFFRIFLGGLLLTGHGLPKMSMILFKFPLWGAHVHPIPLRFGTILAASIEFVAPILVIIGFKMRIAAIAVALLMIVSCLLGPFPFFHEKLFNAVPNYPLLVVPSQDFLYFTALAFLACAYIGPGKWAIDRG